MRFFTKFFLIFVLVVGFSTFVKADPIRITSGTVSNFSINIQGENNTFFYLVPDPPSIITGTDSRFTFAPNSSVNPIVDAFGGYGSFSRYTYRGTSQIEGIPYPSSLFPSAGFSQMTFTTLQSIQLPNAPLPSQGVAPFTVDVPFSMQGYLAGIYYPNGGQNPSSSIPGTSIYGNGTARYYFSYDSVKSGWNIYRYEYTFSGTPEPTPEPATILLLGTGLAGIVGFVRRKNRKKQTD